MIQEQYNRAVQISKQFENLERISLSCESKDSTLEGRYLTTELLPPNDNPKPLVSRCTCSRSALKAGGLFLGMKINYVSLCSGYGAECIAFKRLKRDYPDFDFDCLAWSEIEPNACKAHDAIHEEYQGGNLGDLTKVDWKAWHESIGSPHIDLLFASTPCQSVSNAGKNAGMKKGTDAESALIWATESCIRALNPDIIIYENVKGMVSKRNKPDFDEWCATLESLGYVVQWKILNSRDFGVAQNRERVFPIAIRKDLPMAGHYNYPQGFPLTKCVEDYMEPAEEIGEEYFISQDRVTNKVLSDILDQPNVRAEMEKLYHEEWKERLGR